MKRVLRAVLLLGLAMACCGPAAAQPPNAKAAEYNNMGIAAYNAGHYSESIRYFEKAHELARDNRTVRHNLCNAQQAMANELAKGNKLAEAVELLKTAIGVEPENPGPLTQLGSYHLQQGEVQQAIFRLEEAIELKPGELTAHELLGEAYYRDNDLPAARVQWDYVLQLEPKRKGLKERYEKAFREESVENGYRRGESRHFKVSCPPDTPSMVRSQALTALERAYLQITRRVGGTHPPSPIQVVLYGEGEFSAATQTEEHIAAIYDGKIRSPLIGPDGRYLDEDELGRRLTHEYVHVVLRHLAGNGIPWWLNEGMAQTLSQDFGHAETMLLRKAQDEGGLFNLKALEAHQLKALAAEPLNIAYAQAHAAVLTLWDRYGQRPFQQMLREINGGNAPEKALRNTYRLTYAALQQEVLNRIAD